MSDSIFPSIHPASPPDHPGVYADLAELVRMKFRTRGFSFLPRQPVHSILAGRHASRLRGRGLNSEEIRRYLPGDDIRQMDWRVTARTRKPHVRVYSEERDRPVLLVIDQRQSMFFGSRRAMKSVAATTGGRYAHANDRAALVDIYAQLDALRTHEVQTVSHRPRRELFHCPLGVGVLLSLVYHLTWAVRTGLRRKLYIPATAAAPAGMAAVLPIATGLSQFHFLRPWWLLALIPALGLVWMICRHQDTTRPWRGVIDEHLLPYLLIAGGRQRRLQPVHLLFLIWLLAIVSLSGPTWQREPAPFADDEAALVIALEVTPTMLAAQAGN